MSVEEILRPPREVLRTRGILSRIGLLSTRVSQRPEKGRQVIDARSRCIGVKANGHVRVDIFYRKLSARGQALVNLFGTLLLLLPFCGFLLWISWDYVAVAWTLREGSREAGGLPLVYLLKTLIPLGALLLAIQGISLAFRSLVTVIDTATGKRA